jgi:hypothetical protein
VYLIFLAIPLQVISHDLQQKGHMTREFEGNQAKLVEMYEFVAGSLCVTKKRNRGAMWCPVVENKTLPKQLGGWTSSGKE